MAQSLAKLGSETLKQVTFPGSCDAGVGVFRNGTVFSAAAHSRTQRLHAAPYAWRSVASGFEVFRPVASGGEYKAGHYSYIVAFKLWQGGQSQKSSNTPMH